MNDKKLKNGINEIKRIVMTSLEKKRIFDNILRYSSKNPKSTKSPWSIYAFVSLTQKTKLAYYIIIPIIMILSGAGAVFASQDSLPDGFLYPLKVKVVEPIEGALTFSQKSKAIHESNLASKRLEEAETLVRQGKLDIKEEQKINKLIERHTIALDKALNKIDEVNLDEDKDEIITNFLVNMNAHAQVLDIISKQDNESRENENIDLKISERARFSAEQIRKSTKTEKTKKADKYQERKESIKLRIDQASTDLDLKSLNENKEEASVYESSHEILEQARKYLEESDQKEIEGDYKESY